MAKGKAFRAKDITVLARVNAKPVTSMSYNSGEFNPGLGVDVYKVTGQAAPVVESTAEAATLGLDANVLGPEYVEMLDLQRKAAEGVPGFEDFIITAEFIVNFGATIGQSRVQMVACVLSDGTMSWSGGSERGSASPTLTSGTWTKKAAA